MKVSSNIWNRKLPTTNWLTTNGAVTKKKFGRCLLYYFIHVPLIVCFFQAPAKQTTRRSGEIIMSISYSLSGMLDSPKIMFLNLALKKQLFIFFCLSSNTFLSHPTSLFRFQWFQAPSTPNSEPRRVYITSSGCKLVRNAY